MPIKFEIYRDGKRLSAFTPIAATAMGPESIPIPGQVTFSNGILTVSREDDQAVGISLLWNVGEIGEYQLETTRLLNRSKPYILNVELARHRLMRLMQKLEDWSMLDMPKAEQLTQRVRDAQSLFADALGLLHDPGKAAEKADAALAMSIQISEDVADFQTDQLIQKRRAAGAFVKHIVGCRCNPAIQSTTYRDLLAGSFDYAVVPLSWRTIQPAENKFDTAAVDELIDSLAAKRIPIIAGPILDLTEQGVPDWMFVWEHDFDTLRELAYEYVQKIVYRYRRAVSMWNVAAGIHVGGAFTLTFEQMIEFTRLLVSQIKTMLPNARTIVTIKQPFGEYHARNRSSVPPILYAEMIAQAGINFEAFGIELEMGAPMPGMFVRDIFQISTLLDRYAQLGRPIFLTAVGSPGQSGPDVNDATEGRVDPAIAGRWHRPWDAQLQADWMEAVYMTALSKPYVESIAWSNLAGINPQLPAGGLLDDALKPKPAWNRLQEMRNKFHQWHGKKA